MKKILILGSGAGGTIVANNLRKRLSPKQWDITIIDNDEVHHYQPGWLFIPFEIYTPADCQKPKRDFIPDGVNFVFDEIVGIDKGNNTVEGKKEKYTYDWLVIASGCSIVPEEIEGMMDDWHNNIHDFYTLEGAVALREKMKYFDKGRLVFNIAELPYKCPVAPLEFIFMADWFFGKKGVRDNIEIELVTPIAGAFSKPIASSILGDIAIQKNIKVTPNFDIAQVNADEKTIESHKGDKVDYDLLVSIPPNFGAKFLEGSGLEDPLRFVETEHFTLKAKNVDNIYVIGDATNVPTSKAGAVAHYEAETLISELTNMYKISSLNMSEAIDKTIGTLKNCPHSKKALFHLSIAIRQYRSHDELQLAVDGFVAATGTEWAKILGINIFESVAGGTDVRVALDGILSELKEIKSIIEKDKRANNEAFTMVKFVIPAVYILSIYAAIKFFGFTVSKFFYYQFSTGLGVKFFIIIITLSVLSYAAMFILKKPKFDY